MDPLLVTSFGLFSVGFFTGFYAERTLENHQGIEGTNLNKKKLARATLPLTGAVAFAGKEGASFALGYTIGLASNFVYCRLSPQTRK